MNGLLLVSTFNHFRAMAMPVPAKRSSGGVERLARPDHDDGIGRHLRAATPVSALSTNGSALQTQRPLAIAVIGGMVMTLLLTNIIPVLYSFYGHRDPPEGSSSFAE